MINLLGFYFLMKFFEEDKKEKEYMDSHSCYGGSPIKDGKIIEITEE